MVRLAPATPPETQSAPIALTIAGSDSSGGAGVQADLKTFTAFAVYGASVVTALTAQNTRGVQAVEMVAPAFVLAQLEAVLGDLDVGGVKTGMLGTADNVAAVAARLGALKRCPLVVDPVMVASSGDVLLSANAVDVLKHALVPLARLITPNLPEASRLLDAAPARSEAEMVAQAKALHGLGCAAVLLKGGHAAGASAIDILFDGCSIQCFARPRVATRNSHGTGCVLSAAITAMLARGAELKEAVDRAKSFVWQALEHGGTLQIGHGSGPVDTLFALRGKPLAW
jgi:hydroxymethylpyrimidine/phosphomethylpyrimidine kinase